MKKAVCLILTLSLFMCAFSGYGAHSENSAALVQEAPVPAEGEIVSEVPERGLRFVLSQEYLDRGVELEYPNENVKGYRDISIYYYSPTSKKLLDEVINMDSELRTPDVAQEYTEKIWDTSRCLMEITQIKTAEYEQLLKSGGSAEDISYFTPVEVLGENDGYTYISSIPDLDDGALNEEEAETYHACKAYMSEVLGRISFMPVTLESDETQLGDYIPAFTTEDLYGNEFSADLFTEKTLTVVNVWGTFCGPCIEEMPALAEWADSMDDRVQMIGLVGDIEGIQDAEHLELAKTIVEKAGAHFVNLIPNEDLSGLLAGLIGFPTTFFVDSTGAIVGEPIVGADVDGYKAFVEDYLSP